MKKNCFYYQKLKKKACKTCPCKDCKHNKNKGYKNDEKTS